MRLPNIEWYKTLTEHKLLGATLFVRRTDMGLSVAIWQRRLVITFGRSWCE